MLPSHVGAEEIPRPNVVVIHSTENSFVPLWLGSVLCAVVVFGYAAVKANDALRRRRAGLPPTPFAVITVKVAALAVLGAGFTYEMGVNRNLAGNAFFNNKAQGMPWVVVLLAILFVSWNFVLTRTRYGRHIYAVGGNDEAARRAGVAASAIRISVFVICSGMAAISGLVAASLLQSVQSNAGAGNTLLLAVGAAVIGGTSLFGGHGRIIDAVLGGLVVAVIVKRHERPHSRRQLRRFRMDRHRSGARTRGRLRRGRSPCPGWLIRNGRSGPAVPVRRS